ncbi:hypothetical protein LAZ67_10001807 [Cordylochernes scorpioides]|uniref:Uncharacterized protein n=1 Tax=Cordylochernes scorpioides TaxID=51811 RepID=A0ABY6KYC5_9ARAC|nr:hypothetical protein LAZ67_10001807 [Cordylochernes scorpioides]
MDSKNIQSLLACLKSKKKDELDDDNFSEDEKYLPHSSDSEQEPYQDSTFGRDKITKWFSRFENRMESVKDEKRVGCPILHRNPEKVSQISNLIQENPRIGLRDIEEETGISKSLVGSIIKEDLQLKKTPSKFVPKMLTIQQKENHVEIAKKNA